MWGVRPLTHEFWGKTILSRDFWVGTNIHPHNQCLKWEIDFIKTSEGFTVTPFPFLLPFPFTEANILLISNPIDHFTPVVEQHRYRVTWYILYLASFNEHVLGILLRLCVDLYLIYFNVEHFMTTSQIFLFTLFWCKYKLLPSLLLCSVIMTFWYLLWAYVFNFGR